MQTDVHPRVRDREPRTAQVRLAGARLWPSPQGSDTAGQVTAALHFPVLGGEVVRWWRWVPGPESLA